MPVPNQVKNQHLLWRAGFGPAVEQLAELSKYSPSQYYKAIVKASGKKPAYINVAGEDLVSIYEDLMDAGKRSKLSADDRPFLANRWKA